MGEEKYTGTEGSVSYETIFPKSQYFKCEKCGFCCYSDDIEVNDREARKISEILGIDQSEFIDINKKTAVKRLKHKGQHCVFLQDNNLCKIHRFRPQTCRSFPYKVFFEDISKAYIDIVHGCPNVVLNPSKENEIDFGKIVFKTYKEVQKEPEVARFMSRVKEKIKHNLDKKLAVDKILDYVFDNAKDLKEILDKLITVNKVRSRYDKLKFSVIDDVIESSRKDLVDIKDMDPRSIELACGFGKFKLLSIDDRKPLMLTVDKKIVISEMANRGRQEDGRSHKEIKPDFSYRLIDNSLMIRYLKNLFNKKILEYEVYTYDF
jgi:Fe-S-cluster containining protein